MPRSILIVDDNAINRQMLGNVLQHDYDILEAANGKEALTLIHRHYKLLSAVLLDILMPEMDGYEVLRRTRENAVLANIPIIMVTASQDEASRVKALSLGANDFILKPYNPDIVKHCLRNTITLRETASILNVLQKDKLSGLYNREAFLEKAGAMLKAKPSGYYILSCFDIDNFKLINDQYGVAEGDRIIREIGSAVKLNMNDIGGIAGRISADNFAALFPVARKDTDVLKRIQEKNLIVLERRPIGFSVGRYVATDLTLPASAVYDRAYIAKQSVKGRYDTHLAYFDEVMLNRLVQDQQIISQMEAALAEHQFEVWFQPQYNAGTGALVGAEALARWRHPQKGLIPPGEFVPLFEQNGFVYELDKYVWREACRYMRRWLDQGHAPLPIAVNLSRYDIFRPDLVDVLTGLTTEFDLPISLLHLEITETAFASSTGLIVEIVKQLVWLGFVVEIDDFGSGYSSLNTLKSVPAQVIKLDMRFLEGDDDAQRGGNIIESVVRMAKWLGMSVIAEGVDTKEQGDFLTSIGCSYVQGFLYARPMPAPEYEALIGSAPKEKHLLVLETVENLNNNAFWDPRSMDTLIFNSYVGAACIFEYDNSGIELLRANTKFVSVLGDGTMSLEDTLKLDWAAHFPLDSLARLRDALSRSADTGKDVSDEYVLRGIPGAPAHTHLRMTVRVIAIAGPRQLVYCMCENITAQRLAEQSERRVIKQLQAVLDNVNCGITAVRFSGKDVEYLLSNDKYYEMLGYTRQQYHDEMKSGAFSTVHPNDQARVREMAEYVVASGEPVTTEFRALRRDGGVLWLRCFTSMTSFEGVDERVQLSVYTDITAEKNAALELLNNLPDGAGLYEFDGRNLTVIHRNKRYWELVGRTQMRGRNTSVLQIIHPDDRAVITKELTAAIEQKRDAACDLRLRTGRHGYRPFRITGRIVPKADGVYSVYASYTPISDEATSLREMLPVALEMMMASSSDLAFIKDRNLRYICCSRTFALMAGLGSEKEIVGKTDSDLFEPALAEQYAANDRRLLKTREPLIDMVSRLPSPDAKPRYYRISKYPLFDSFGSIVGIYGSGHDITQLRDAETRQRFLINNIPGGIAVYEGRWDDLSSVRLTYFSDGFCRLFGYNRAEYEALCRNNAMGLVSPENLASLETQIRALGQSDAPMDLVYRARAKDGVYRWIHVKAVLSERRGAQITVNAVLFDVTQRQDALDQLRVSEEENRLAIQHSGNVVCRFDVAKRTLRVSPGVDPMFQIPLVIADVPYGPVRDGKISPETAEAYVAFYEGILNGQKSGSLVYQRLSTQGWRWIEAQYSTIFAGDGEPISAVLSFLDATESYEKDVAYKKWQQSLHNKKPDSYSLYRCSVSKETVFDTQEGALLSIHFAPGRFSFSEHTAEYAGQYVLEEDAVRFRAFLNVNALQEKYHRGERIISLEYREKRGADDYRWLRLTVELVEYPHSTDIEAYLLFEDIDALKRAALLTLERAQTDPLTGMLNRTTFAERVEQSIRASGPNTQHALLLLDIDGFKLVNDVFGHAAGDQTLIDIANLLRTALRRGDLVGRLGGDEFLIFLNDIPAAQIATNKAKQICALSRKAFSTEVQISGSVGIAVYPHDGKNFETLYKKADETLYFVKGSGKDNFAFYHEDMKNEHLAPEPDAAEPNTAGKREKKRRMLIVDDSKLDCELLANMFRDSFIIEKARDGKSALIRLRHYTSAISVVLLDLIMPGMDGFEVLEKMQQSPEISSIPVIVVSSDGNRETSLQAIRAGASDYVMKPVDPDVLRIRVQSAISKAENERLRAKNSYLELRSSEAVRYKTVLGRIGVIVTEMDWGKGSFTYDPCIGEYLAGRYDGRTLWHVLLSDLVADAQTVKRMQQLVHGVADDRRRADGSDTVQLKTPSGEKHRFRFNVYKLANEYGLTDKMILTFSDVGPENNPA